MIIANYVCLDCGDVFQNRTQAILHHISTKHENYQLVGSDLKMTVRS